MTDHQQKADAVESEIDGLERESERLGAQIGETRDDWERKKGDEKVPGADDAAGYASQEDDGLPPETEHPTDSVGGHKQQE